MILMGTLTAAALLLAAPFTHRRWRQHRLAKRLVITTPHGISESRFVPIGGIEQWVSLRGDDRRNPALLIVHGGPGSSYEMFAPIMRPWEEHFTIVQWDQRGAGRTFGRNGADGSGEVNVARLAADGIEVAEWVRAHLGHDRLILVGSSFGSVIALHMTHQRPDLFSAYVGTDQNVSMTGDLQPTLDRLRAMGKHKGVAKLENIGADPARWSPKDWTTVAKLTMQSDPGPDPIKTLIGPAMWFCPTMTLKDMKHLFSGMEFSSHRLSPEFAGISAWLSGTHQKMPFFIFQGENDVLTEPQQAAAFFADVQAPHKEMALIPGAGHFAAFTHPEEFLRLLLAHVRPMSNVSRCGDSGLRSGRQR